MQGASSANAKGADNSARLPTDRPLTHPGQGPFRERTRVWFNLSVRIEELSPALQKRVRARIGAPEKAKRTSQHTSAEGKFHMRCECGEAFTVEAAFARHTPTKGHRRAEVVF